MIVNIRTTYQIEQFKAHEQDVDIDLLTYLLKIRNDIESEDDLEDFIKDYINWFCDIAFVPEIDQECVTDDPYVTVENMQELIDAYKYLIIKKEEPTCCEKSSNKNFVYCSQCGTKLIY